jgi:2-iminoacetate synthase
MGSVTAAKTKHDAVDFIDDGYLARLLAQEAPSPDEIERVLDKCGQRKALTVEETAVLLRAPTPELRAKVSVAAQALKTEVYGRRIVLFAPLYVGSLCINDCAYCGFRLGNRAAVRRTIQGESLRAEVEGLQRSGHKRLILVFGEHPRYSAQFMAECVREVYSVRVGHGEIRRVNINAAPLEEDGYRIVKEAGIGTYQIFQETYHHETYARMHPQTTRKGDYLYRLHGLGRALAAGCDDVGIGALFGLYDWRFEVLGLVSHACYLQDHYGVGPHTISFPRMRPASGMSLALDHAVSDEDFLYLIAVLRLAVPYTGLICTAREPSHIRRQALRLRVSQIDGGSRIDLGGYSDDRARAEAERAQFELGDTRTLAEVTRELLADGHVPSYCTACYRMGRTGEHFMELAIPGFIKRFCTPNALCTLLEYLIDYGDAEARELGEKVIAGEIAQMQDGPLKEKLVKGLERIRTEGARDVRF